MSDPGKAVFLSYASQDAEAAKRICEALRAAGIEVWFDQNELVGGDQWDAKIRGQIGSCALFMPLISANTQARREGYFRIEWRLAAQRTHAMSDDTMFLLPIMIDETGDAEAKVPAEFKTVQWTRLKGGETPATFVARVKKLLAGEEAGRDRRIPPSARAAASGDLARQSKGRRWLLGIIGGAAVVAVAAYFGLHSRANNPAPTAALTPKLSPARELAEQAWEISEHPKTNPEALRTAVEMGERAVQLDSMDGEVWATAALLDIRAWVQGSDRTDRRLEAAITKIQRAKVLGPRGLRARLAEAKLAASIPKFASRARDAETILRALLQEKPPEWEATDIKGTLGLALEAQGRLVEAAAMLAEAGKESAGWMNAASWAYLEVGRLDEALATAQRETAMDEGNGKIQEWRVQVARGDLAAAEAIALEPGFAFFDWLRGDAETVLADLKQEPRDYVPTSWNLTPKRLLAGWAHHLAGREEAARTEWLGALQVVDRKTGQEGPNYDSLDQRCQLLALLSRKEAAAEAYQLLHQLFPEEAKVFDSERLVLLGRKDEAYAALANELRNPHRAWAAHGYVRLAPSYAPLRSDPRVLLLLRETLPSGAKPLEVEKTKDHGPQTISGSLSLSLSLSPSTPPDSKSVAVLAFANLSDDKANEYFSDGISEELLNVLAKIQGLKVAARTSAFYFKGKEVPVPEIARQLGVAYVVEGSVRRQGDKVRITAQLIKAADGFHVWSETFTRDLKDIFAVQDEIAGLIAKNLELKMGIGEMGVRQEVSPAAYQEYLLGRAAAAKAGMADLREAVTHFDRAVALEPKYTAAWVQLASAHTRLGRWGGAPTRQAWAAARAAIDRARALEPDSPEVLLALGWILRTGEWNWREAERAFRRALALQPNQPEILAGAAVLLFNIGQTDEAFRLARQAIQLDPLNAGTQIDLSLMFHLNKNWPEAERSARRALQLAPRGTSYHCLLAWGLIAQQRFPEAETEIKLDNSEDGVDRTLSLGLLALARGEEKVARDWLARLEEIARTNGDLADLQQNIAWLNTSLGDKDRAFAALEKAYTSRDPSMAWLLNSWWLEPLVSDPRWPVLVRKVGLADEQLK